MRMERFQALSDELRTQRERLRSVTERIHREIHPLPGSLERLLSIPTADPPMALNQAANVLGEALACEKVDIFFPDEQKRCLVALGVSSTDLGRLQQELGLDRLPLSRGGRVAKVFQSGSSYLNGHLDGDPEERADIPQRLGVHSEMIVAVDLAGGERAVLAASALRDNAFDQRDLRFMDAAAHWVAVLAERLNQHEATPDEAAAAAQAREAGRLTARQREIALLIARGLSNAEIARELVLTPGTVANHVAQILQRLDCSSRTQIGVWAVRFLAPLFGPNEGWAEKRA
jgi:DNA-binding CsgD family transcriptional regulator